MTLPPAQSSSATTHWALDPSHTTLGFSIAHLVIARVRGEFGKVSGVLALDEVEPGRSSIEASVDVASITTRDEARDAHLRSADFFDTARFPTATFKSSKVTRARGGAFTVDGELSLHGVTGALTLDVVGLDQEVTDPWGNTKRAATATGTIRRKDFGITWNKALDKGALALGDDVQLSFELEFTKRAP
jgi:polyisoprenoid-binding protein YceI